MDAAGINWRFLMTTFENKPLPKRIDEHQVTIPEKTKIKLCKHPRLTTHGMGYIQIWWCPDCGNEHEKDYE